jgi:hypothetical protein
MEDDIIYGTPRGKTQVYRCTLCKEERYGNDGPPACSNGHSAILPMVPVTDN